MSKLSEEVPKGKPSAVSEMCLTNNSKMTWRKLRWSPLIYDDNSIVTFKRLRGRRRGNFQCAETHGMVLLTRFFCARLSSGGKTKVSITPESQNVVRGICCSTDDETVSCSIHISNKRSAFKLFPRFLLSLEGGTIIRTRQLSERLSVPWWARQGF